MTKVQIVLGRRELSFEEAVEEATRPEVYGGGVIEALQARIEEQNKLMARLLMAFADDYGDHYSDPMFEPKTRTTKLEFVLGDGFLVNEV